jgi:hypothetical protein
MPLLVNRYIFSLAPSLAPFFLRPLLWPICSLLDAKIVAEPLTASLKYVRTLFVPFLGYQYSYHYRRLKTNSTSLPPGGLQVVKTQRWPII